jgi:hypothetical protein
VSLPGAPTRLALAPAARAYAVADVYVTAAALPTVHAVTVTATTIAEVQSIRTDAANASETLSGAFSLSFGGYDPALTVPVRTSDARVAYSLYATQPLAAGGYRLTVFLSSSNAYSDTPCIAYNAGEGEILAALEAAGLPVNSSRVKTTAGAPLPAPNGTAGAVVYPVTIFLTEQYSPLSTPTPSSHYDIIVPAGAPAPGCAAFAAAPTAPSSTLSAGLADIAPLALPEPLPYNASADAVAAALTALPDLLAVNVLRSLASVSQGYAYTVTLAALAPALAASAPALALPKIGCSAAALGAPSATCATATGGTTRPAIRSSTLS